MAQLDADTISAIATAPGRGGIGIVRVSGPLSATIAQSICDQTPKPRTATTTTFKSVDGSILDEGIALYFPKPNSFTGEDVLELQGHGGPHVLHSLLRCTLDHGARIARPGEFTERAFLNNKIDLLQAEAIADLIGASSERAARGALRTLQGEFSAQVRDLLDKLVFIRTQVEAAIDFSDENLELLGDSKLASSFKEALSLHQRIMDQAQQGALLQEGLAVVIAGEPNAGKSSLLNALAGTDSAIVTDVPGTTRDLLKEQLNLQGLPVHVTDTAGLRHSDDAIEVEGVRRARDAISKADRLLLVIDSSIHPLDQNTLRSNLALITPEDDIEHWFAANHQRLCVVANKLDLLDPGTTEPQPGITEPQPGITEPQPGIKVPGSITHQGKAIPVFPISAKHRIGIGELVSWLMQTAGFDSGNETPFIARERHLQALQNAGEHLHQALSGLNDKGYPELIAEDLRLAQHQLGTITGDFTSDDLLGEIFSSFCIGK